MATVEQLLVKIGVDPASVNRFLQDVDRVVTKAEGQEVNIAVQTTAGRNLASVTVATQALGAAAQKTTNSFQQGLTQVRTAATQLRTGLLALSAVAGIGLAGSIRAASTESTNFARANVILRLSQEDLLQAQNDLRAVADETGLSFQEVSEALFDVASAGFTGAEAIEVTTAAARVAVPAGTSVAVAFNAIATAMKNFGFSAADAGDALVKVADLSRATLGDISNALGILGPIAGQFSVSFAEVGASLAQITEQGVSADLAATALQQTLLTFISPSEKAKIAFQRLGIATGDAAFESQTLADKIDLIKEASAAGTVEIAQLFENVRALRGAAVLITNAEAVAEKVEEIGTAAGRTQQALDDFFSQAGPQLDKLGASFINLITVVGADLLNALLPTIKALEEFIRTNREVVAESLEVVIVVGSIVAALLLFGFVASQAAAAVQLVIGGLNILTGSLVANTAAQTTNTAAREAAITPQLFSFFATIKTFLLAETVSVFNLARGYGILLVARIKSIAGRFLTTLRTLPFLFNRETAAIAANSLALGANTGARGLLNAVAGRLSTTLSTNIARVSALSAGLGVLGAAFVGVQIGGLINDSLGLSDAFAETARTGEISFGTIGAAAAILATGPIGILIGTAIQLDALFERISQRTLQPIERAELEQDADLLERFNKIVAEGQGISERAAFVQAINDNARIIALEKIEKAGKLSTDQEQDLANSRLRVAAASEAAIKQEEELGRVSADTTVRRKQLADNEKALAKVREQTAKDLIRVRSGETAAEIAGFQASFDKRIQVLRRQGALELAEVRETEERIKRARDAGANDTGLKGLLETLRTQQSDLRRTTQDIADNFEIFQDRIVRAGASKIAALRSQGEQEISIARRTANAVIREEERKASLAIREIDRLRAARDRGVADAASFLEQLRDAAIRELDPALAQLRRFEREAFAGLTGATAQQAEQTIEFIRQRLLKLAEATDEEAAAQERLAAVSKALAEADDADDNTQLLEEQTELEAKLANLQERRAIRANAAQAAERALTEQAEGAADRQLKSQQDIEAQQQKIEDADFRIAEVKTLIALREKIIGAELEANIAREQLLIKANLERLRLAAAFARVLSTFSQGGAVADTARQALEAATERVQQLQLETTATLEKERIAVGDLEQKAEDAFEALARDAEENAERTRKTAEVTARLAPLADETARRVAAAETAQGQFVSSVDKLLDASGELNSSFTGFAETVVTKNEEQATVNSNTARQIADLQSQLAATQVTPQDEQRGGGL